MLECYKARLVAKGHVKKLGRYFNEIFSLLVKLTIVRVVLALVETHDLDLEQLDFKIDS